MELDFQSSTVLTPEWKKNKALPKDKQFTVTCRTLETKDLFAILDVMAPIMDGRGNVDVKSVGMDQVKVLNLEVGKILPAYLTVDNLSDRDGPVTPGRIFTDPRFLHLSIEVISFAINNSQPSDDDEGN